ncbi:hypothetical protein Q7P35_003967 [Cladosporium inversicolor]
MRIPVATLLLLAGSIAAPIDPKPQVRNEQEVLTKLQPLCASDIDPLRDCDLPNSDWGLCAGALRYSMRYSPNTCIKSIQSLTNGDW